MNIARIQFEGLNLRELENYETYLLDNLKMVKYHIRQERQGSSDNENHCPPEEDHTVSAYNTTVYQNNPTDECNFDCYQDGRRHANEECNYDFGQPDNDDDNDENRPSEEDHIGSAYNTTVYQNNPTDECNFDCYHDGRRHTNEECDHDFGQPNDDHNPDDN